MSDTDQWTHHDPAVRDLIRRAQADAWDEGANHASEAGGFLGAIFLNPYRDEVTR